MFKRTVIKYLLAFYLCYNLLFFKISALGVTTTVNKQHLEEIHHLKSELFKSLDSDQFNVKTKDGIVQPSCTLDKSDKTETVKVEANEQNRKEAADLRSEIQHAVSTDSYFAAGSTKTKDIKSLQTTLTSKEKNKEILLLAEKEPSKPLSPEEKHPEAGTISEKVEQKNDSNAPNIIFANLDDSEFDMRKLQRLELSKRRNREVLIVKYIEEDFAFNLGAEVNEWKHITHAGEEYFIGRRVTDLLIVHKVDDEYEQAMVLDIGHIITYIESYTYWNAEEEQHEGVIVVATAEKILWYRSNQATKLIELYWEWTMGNVITALTHFNLDSNNYLTMSTNQSFLAGHYALNIYEYNLKTKEFWIAQRLQLEFPCEDLTVLNTGRDVILAIPQNETAKIYTFNPHEAAGFSHIHFQLKRSVNAEGINTIASFKMGGRSYLALTGYQPQILLYQQGDFISKTILDNNFGWVELFFPIPIRTYRDDLVLLVQHRVDFGTHIVTVVEALIWDGEAFETSVPIPCRIGKLELYGVGCMIDSHRSEGLKGAALLKRGDMISVLVPRYKAESGLFRFHTKLLAKNSEFQDFQRVFKYLRDWVGEQDSFVNEANIFLKLSQEELLQMDPKIISIETLETIQFELNGEAKEIYVNDYLWTREDSGTDLYTLIETLEALEKSLTSGRQRRNRDDIQQDELDFDEVTVEDLEVKKVNGEQYFIQKGELNFDGLVNITELDVLETLTNLEKLQGNEEDFTLNGNLEFDQINGVNWLEIENNFLFRTESQNLENLEVKGSVLAESPLNINTLNTLNFPDDYLLTNGPVNSTVTAEKHFVNSLSVSSVDTTGFVNGKNPKDAITLTDPQEWQGMPAFKQLKVTEVLEVHGEIHGLDEKKFPNHPTLHESNIIEANCHFNEITVNGSLILKGYIDDQPLGPLLKDILLKTENPEDELSVPSKKSFNIVSFPLDFQLENQTINKISVNEFVTLHTNQTLDITSMEGYVYFYKLFLNGSYDGVKIEDVLKEVILLDQVVDLSSTELIFSEKLKANSVVILETLNKHKIKDNLQSLQEDLNIDNAEFESLYAHQGDFSNDILGPGKLNNIELHTFVNKKDWHEPPIRGNIFLNELILEKGIQTDELHGIKAEYLLDFLNQIDELPDMVLNGQVKVERITVTGDVQLNKLNGLLFDEEIQLTTIKLQHPNFLSSKLSFRKSLDIKGQLNVIADFRGKYLPDLMDDIIVRTTNSCINITAPKSFLQPVQVLENTQIEALNGISMQKIAWKTKTWNSFNGSVYLKGNLIAKNLNLQGNLNNFNWRYLEDLLYFDENLQNFILKNTLEFKEPLLWEDLTIKGDLNSIRNLSDFFENLIYKNNFVILNGKKTFTGRVYIDRGTLIENLNGHDLYHLFNNIALVHEFQPIHIQSPVIFKDSVHANDLQIQKSLVTEYLSGCSIAEWLNTSLRVDQDENITHPLRFAAGSIDGNSLLVHFLNDIDLSRIITLNTPQAFNETVKFCKVILKGLISSKALVNNVDLEKVFNNTLKIKGQQHVLAPLTTASVSVLGNLLIKGLINGNKNLTDVATLHEDLVFESPLYFKKIYTSQVILKDLVTGIDFNKWFDSAVRYQNPITQFITGKWSTKFLTVKTATKDIQYLINGFEPGLYYTYKRVARNENNELYTTDEQCFLIQQIWLDLGKKPVFVKYVEECLDMDFDPEFKNKNESLNKAFMVKSNEQYFLVINLKCESLIYQWLKHEDKFVFKTSFESGPIDEIEVISYKKNNSNHLQFITNFEATENIDCHLKPLKKWKVENDTIVLDSILAGSPNLIYKYFENNSSLWALYNETLEELDADYEIKQKLQLPVKQNQTRYRFVPLKEEQEILLTNGKEMVLISKHLAKKSTNSFLNTQDPQMHSSNLNQQQFAKTETLLKPNNSITLAFVFSEFKPVIERILTDLKQRLNQQVNITQLSIPESDLFDEHLVTDFLAIMEELHKQNIYESKVFNFSLENIMLPENPSQVLAAHVVQITWPVVKAWEKINSYFKTNESDDHPLCDCISKSLGFLINDVLLLANEGNNSKEVKLNNVIQRIREFENDLNNFLEAYTNYYDQESPVENLEQSELLESASNLELNLVYQNQSEIMFINKSFLPGYKQGEILSLVVGCVSNPHQLWAVTNTNVALAGKNNPGIYIYLHNIKGQLYQLISAIKPRSLQQLRIKQETMLLYIQECCQVQIWKYRGSQGFIKFNEINSNESIKQILTISVPSHQGNFKYFLLLLMEKDIKFYEFILEGYDSISPAFIPYNCL